MKWDNRLFGISDNEAVRIDPQQRYVLECTHMALEDGGFTREQMAGSKTGVFIGVYNVLIHSVLYVLRNFNQMQ